MTASWRNDAALAGLLVSSVYLADGLAHALTGADPTTLAVACAPLLAVAIVALAVRSRPASPPTPRLADAAWPLAAWPLVYTSATDLVMLDRWRFVDGPLAHADAWLMDRAPGPPPWPLGGSVEELASAAYASFYFVIPAAFVWLWTRRERDDAARLAVAVLGALAACSVVWLAFPAGGYHEGGCPTSPAPGPCTALVRDIYAAHPHFAGAFPSSHVALATTTAAVMWGRGGTRWWALWPISISWATVYGQYHYFVDSPPAVLVGLGAAAWAMRERITVPEVIRSSAWRE